jgi:hypothetical protein
MAQAASDPGTGPVSPSKRKREVSGIIPIPAGTGTMPGAVFVQPLPVPPKPVSSTPASTSTPPSSSPASNGVSSPVSSISPSFAINSYPGSSGFSYGSASSGLPYFSVSPTGSVNPDQRTTSSTGSVDPYPRPQYSVLASSSGVLPRPYPPSPSGGPSDINISINFNQTIYVNSPDYGIDGYGWWMCSESDESTPSQAETTVTAIPEYDVGSCIVNVAVMEYVHIVGEVKSTETVCLTTYGPESDHADNRTTVVADCVCRTS